MIYSFLKEWRNIAGLLLFLTLLILNIAVAFKGDSIITNGPRNLPPEPKFLQQITYDTELNESVYDRWGSGFSTVQSISDNTETQFVINLPDVRAVTGRLYTYKPELINIIEQYTIEVLDAPAGVYIKDNTVFWEPEKQQTGEHILELLLELPEHDSDKALSYSVTVTEERFILGTDERGRSLTGLLIAGSKWTLLPGLIALLITLPGGLLLGGLSGFYTGYAAHLLEYMNRLLEMIPALLLIFLMAVITEFNIYWTMVGVGLVLLPGFAESIKSNVSNFRKSQFAESSKELGLKDSQILWKEIIWTNCKIEIFSYIPVVFAFSIMVEVTLSYLGIGVQIPETSWGLVLNSGRAALFDGNYWITLFPGITVVVVIMGAYLFSDGIKKSLRIS